MHEVSVTPFFTTVYKAGPEQLLYQFPHFGRQRVLLVVCLGSQTPECDTPETAISPWQLVILAAKIL
jgi:hypothetical protein